VIWKTVGIAILLIAATPASLAADIQAKRLDAVRKLTSSGIIYKLEKPGLFCHLWVGPPFASLPFDDKQQIAHVVYSYCNTTDARATIVVLKDSRTGKEVGEFSTYSGGLRLK